MFLEFGYFLVQLGKFGFILFPLDGFALDFQLFQPAFDFVQLFGKRITLHTEFCGCLVHQVDSLIGQETVGDVTVAQFYGGNDGFVFDTHLVVVLVTLLQATQDRDRACRVGFVHHDGLEPTLQGFILFEILLVFVKGSGTDAPQFATCQCRFQDIGCIHGTFTFSCTYQCVDFIDEQDDVSL